jgi:hypothetical protein
MAAVVFELSRLFDDDGVKFGKSEGQASSLHKLTAFPLGIVFSTYELPLGYP